MTPSAFLHLLLTFFADTFIDQVSGTTTTGAFTLTFCTLNAVVLVAPRAVKDPWEESGQLHPRTLNYFDIIARQLSESIFFFY